MPRRVKRTGHLVVAGAGERMLPSRVDGFLTTREAAKLIGVEPVTIRQWRKRDRGADPGGRWLECAAY